MFAKSKPLHSSDTFKRKSTFADDKQPWPSNAYKRQCYNHVARDKRMAHLGQQVPSADSSAYAWMAKADWQATYRACGSIPMQRVLRQSLELASAPDAPMQPMALPYPVRPALQRFHAFYDLEI